MRSGSSPLMDDISRSFDRLVTSPGLLVAIVITLAIHFSHLDDFSTGPVGQLAQRYPNNTWVKFMVNEYDKLLGASIIVPVLWDVKAGPLTVIISLALILLGPPLSIWVYGIIGAGLLLLFTSRHPVTRLVLVGGLILAGFTGVINTGSSTTTVVPSATFASQTCPAGYVLRVQATTDCLKVCVSGIYLQYYQNTNGAPCKLLNQPGTCKSGLCVPGG